MTRKEARLQEIRSLLAEQKEMRIADLANAVHASTETIRHDLESLERAGAVVREHGTVRLVQSILEPPLAWREHEFANEKRAAAWAALNTVHDGEVIYVDAGTTLILGLPALKSKKDITVATNSLPVAGALCDMDIKTIMIGGFLFNRGKRCHGGFACNMVDGIQFDVAFMGTDGFEDATGFTTVSENELGTKRHIIQQSKKIVVVTDRTKFRFRSPYTFCRFNEVDLLVTNQLDKTDRQTVSAVGKVLET